MSKVLSLEEHFRLLQIEKNLAVALARKRLRQRLEANAQFQRGKLMTTEERGRKAIELMTQKLIERNRAIKGDANTTEDEARKQAQQLQAKVARNKNIE